ncbi:MAG: hypothetical protein ACHQUC_03665 [Chlamydiales bacterium]
MSISQDFDLKAELAKCKTTDDPTGKNGLVQRLKGMNHLSLSKFNSPSNLDQSHAVHLLYSKGTYFNRIVPVQLTPLVGKMDSFSSPTSSSFPTTEGTVVESLDKNTKSKFPTSLLGVKEISPEEIVKKAQPTTRKQQKTISPTESLAREDQQRE